MGFFWGAAYFPKTDRKVAHAKDLTNDKNR